MIGVIANPSEHAVIREFFELFKTPWEFCHDDRQYDVLLCDGDLEFPKHTAKVVLIYAGRKLPSDTKCEIQIASQRKDACVLSYNGTRIPIYGASVTFRSEGTSALLDEDTHEPTIQLDHSNERLLVRIGYDLFREVRFLLAKGQPAVNASIPSLELHISVLRDLIIANGISLVEVPPVPEGYRFIACLTHDVDHPSIRLHKCNHTVLGFLYRAVLGSLINVFRGRCTVRTLLNNWKAVVKLPFVHLGLAKDYWSAFDCYPKLEGGVRSSFFLIPFKDSPGLRNGGPAPKRRASSYGVSDLGGQIQTLMSNGCEIGLHGIDAWFDSSKGCEELEQIRRITGMQDIGVRMHWLYFSEQSPATLEQAGADYDSTIGYNETIGYRAGTTQVYRPLGATRLLELPLHIMDTALFFPSHMDLSPKEAGKRVSGIIDNAVQFGGTVTVNWHDRSVAPERCWGDFYVELVDKLKTNGAWFATAAETVAWFRKRRRATFENVGGSDELCIKKTIDVGENLPSLHFRIHNECATTTAS